MTQQKPGIIVRLAETPAEIEAAQRLRYHVFYEEQGAPMTPKIAAIRRDIDEFDAHMDHLIVIDPTHGQGNDRIIGTYRLMRQDQMEKAGRFYTSDEFDIEPLILSGARLMELGRSCVLPEYRTMPVLQALWTGIARYVGDHKIDLMFGCASFHGTDPGVFADEFSYLYHNHLAPAEARPVASPNPSMPHLVVTPMNLRAADTLNTKKILTALPPLVKGYLRLGATIGDGAVIDKAFNTIDVCIVFPTHLVTEKYLRHYQRDINKPLLQSDSPFAGTSRHEATT